MALPELANGYIHWECVIRDILVVIRRPRHLRSVAGSLFVCEFFKCFGLCKHGDCCSPVVGDSNFPLASGFKDPGL